MTGWKAREYQVADRHPDIAAARERLRAIAKERVGNRFAYDDANYPPDMFTEALSEVLLEWKAAVTRDVNRTNNPRPGPPLPPNTTIDWGTKVQLGLIARAPANTTPPPARARHAALVFRGTGGIIGLDYVSRVCQGAADLVEEINPDFPASMGGLPPGAPGTPSAARAIEIGYRAGVAWIRANPRRTFLLGGYSLGAIVAARLRAALRPGGELEAFAGNFVAAFAIGDPSRPFGGSYYLGPVPGGVGISSWRLPADCIEPRYCWLTDPADMYANIPVPVDGGTGDIMETVFDMVTGAAINDPLGTVRGMIPHLLEVVSDAGILRALPIGPALLANPLAAVPIILPMLVSTLPGLIAGIGGGVGGNMTGPAAAAQAAILGMRFLVTGTRPHIEYHAREVWPGQTYLGLAIQHVRDWAGRTPVGN